MSEIIERLNVALAGRYVLEREIGRGGMATVFLAADLKHRRPVAIKVISPEIMGMIGPDRFLREIETVARLSHPQILPLHDSGAAGDLLFFVMPYVEGESLRDRLRREKQLSLDDALRISREVADALDYAHDRDIVHRDIKPENILISHGHALLMDFGIARAIRAAGGSTTEPGQTLGTPAYMSPEQTMGEAHLDRRSDQYSLACVVYEMLAGQPPFTGATAEIVAHQHLAVEPRSVSELRPATPPEVAVALGRALSKTPADRFGGVTEFLDALTTRAPHARASRRFSRPGVYVAMAGAAILATVILMMRQANPRQVTLGATSRVTLEPGLELDPALSPDGRLLAYAAGPPEREQIHVRALSGGRVIALTADTSGSYRWPRWVGDGAQVAFQSNDGIWVVPALGGEPRRLVRVGSKPLGFDLSPDGTRAAFALKDSNGVFVQSLSGGPPVAVTRRFNEAHSVAWSPDGRFLAFVVGNASFTFHDFNAAPSAIWVIPATGGVEERVTDDQAMNVSPSWGQRGRGLYWVSNREGTRDVYFARLTDSGRLMGKPVRLTTGLNAHGISLDGVGAHLACSVMANHSNVWAIDLPTAPPAPIRSGRPVTIGNQRIESVDISRDGRWLAFDSDRAGNFDIFKMPLRGGEATRVTIDPGDDFVPRWSPDGRSIVYHSFRMGQRDVFTIDADGGGEMRRTDTPWNEYYASFSADGRSVVNSYTLKGEPKLSVVWIDGEDRPPRIIDNGGYHPRSSPTEGKVCFVSGFEDHDELTVFDLDSGRSRAVVVGGSGSDFRVPTWSPDGRTLYYYVVRPPGGSIWAVPASGGPSRRLIDGDATMKIMPYAFASDGRSIYLSVHMPQSDISVTELKWR